MNQECPLRLIDFPQLEWLSWGGDWGLDDETGMLEGQGVVLSGAMGMTEGGVREEDYLTPPPVE